MTNGTAIIDVSADFLGQAAMLLPSTYRIIGSEMSPSLGVVRLIVESADIAGHDMQLTCEVTDQGSTRTARMIPVARR